MNSHFMLLVVFSALVSLVFTFIAKHEARERAKYFLYLFGSFVLLSVLVGWIMYPFPWQPLLKADATGSLRRFIIFRLPVLLYAALIFYISSGPIESETINEVPDYLLHGAAYALFYILAFWAIHEGLGTSKRPGGFWLPAILTILYGASDEWHQSFIPGRDPSAHDVAADAAGALLALWLVRWLRAARRRHLDRRTQQNLQN